VPVLDRALTRLLGLPAARTGFARRPERVPMRDGVQLMAEHWMPATDHALGTVLVRTPYGRGTARDVSARVLAARGYHVLVQSVRGTFGSGGVFEPMADEARDGLDTVAWLREQAWFDGRLATYGASYLGWTQWALLADAPPELRTSVVVVGPHDFAASVYGTGAFAFHGFTTWSDLVVHQERAGLLDRTLWQQGRLNAMFAGHPGVAAVERILDGRAPWLREWVAHDDPADPFWDDRRTTGPATASVPVLLVGGWQDLFLEQTVTQYRTLHERGVDVALTIGPWTHIGAATHGTGQVLRETLAWLDEHLAAATGRTRRAPVHVHVTGAGDWRALPSWPPPTTPLPLTLAPAGHLTPGESFSPAGRVGRSGSPLATFRYDPADPTPSVGGRLLAARAGVVDNRALAARPDVATFTADALTAPLEIAGTPVVELDHHADPPHADVFVRLCDVAPDGRAENVADGMLRLRDHAGPVRIELDPCHHVLAAGHRIMLLVAGGAHPRFLRNPGTGEPPAEATGLVAVTHTITGGTLRLPVAVVGDVSVGDI
jgi:uncharacterized protein